MPIGQFTTLQWRKLTGWLNDGIIPPNIKTSGTSPSVVKGANAGNSAVVSLVPASTDSFGEVIITTAGSPAAGEMAKLTFATPIIAATINGVPNWFDPILGWGTGSVSGQVYAVSGSINGFTINFSSAPANGVTYLVSYLLVRPIMPP